MDSRKVPLRASLLAAASAMVFPLAMCAAPNELPSKPDPRLQPVFQAMRVWNAVASTSDGRVFVGYSSADGPGLQVEELLRDGTRRPYPNVGWNAWMPGRDPASAFVHVNALRIGPDGCLWIVDAGSPGFGKPSVPGGPRILKVDLTNNKVSRIYSLQKSIHPMSYIDDIRFNGATAYLTDAGAPGLLVLDLKSGETRRVLDGDPSTTDTRPMYADGKLLRTKDGKALHLNADQLEVSPDGMFLYYQPACGPLARIETRWLDELNLSAGALASHVERWLDTPTSGGTAIDDAGNIYYADANKRRILKITPSKEVSTVVADPRLIWSDAMWIDSKGFLWIPATQQNLTPGFNSGKQEVKYPVWIYKIQIGQKPPPNDHS